MIQTERLTLVPVTPQTIEELFRTATDKEVSDFFGVDEKGLVHYRDMYEKGMETHRISHFFFVLRLTDTGTAIGECGFHTWNRTHRRAELFYLLRKDEHKNKGYVSEALKEVLKFGFTELGLHRVQACLDHANIPSLKLVLRSGFVREGTARQDYCINGVNEDSEVYSLLKWDWEQNMAIKR